ncbi:MAG: DUF559 domain-containing protein [Actinomycetota bacterium]
MTDHIFDINLRTLALGQHGLVSRAQARAAGGTAEMIRLRLASPDWDAVTYRVLRLVGTPSSDQHRAMAAVLDAGPGTAVSHQSAAAMWGLPGFDAGTIHVSRPRGGPARSSPLAVVHWPTWLPDQHVSRLDGVPVTTVARTIFDLASDLHPKRVARTVDNALARRLVRASAIVGLCSSLAEQGRAGTRLMRELMAERDGAYVAPESGLEARFLALVAAAGLPTPERQVDVGGDDWVGRVDFLFRPERLVAEIDGDLSHTALLDQEADDERDRRLRAAGYEVVRVTARQVWYRPDEAISLLRAALSRAA